MTTAARGFAVLDLETTGLSAQRERVIEVAVVHLDPQGRVQQTWATLIHPGRSSVGATHIHGITAADVRDAPVFEDIAPQLVGLLAGRVLVAHNAQFDLPFLRLEMARAGIQMPDVPHLCTLQESWRHLPALRRRRLSDCCAATAIPLLDAHTALADATAAAALLAWYLRAPTAKTWSAEPMLQAAAAVGWPSVVLPPSPRLPRPRGVPAQEAVPAGPGRLARLLDSLPLDAPGLSQPAVSGYVEVLAAALSDGVLTDAEVDSLVEAATGAGLSRFQVLEVHRGVVLGLARAVVVDGVVTAREQEQLAACAAALDLDAEEVTLALSGAHAERVVRLSEDLAPLPEGWALGDPLRLGDAIVFTGGGDIARAQLERRTREAGLRVVSAVSRRTAVLVAGNPASGTAKARKAMELGTRVVDLTTYGRLLDHVQPLLQSRPGTSAVTQPSPTREEAHPTTHTPHAFVDVKATEVRAWARARGITVGDRGRLPQALTDAYLAHLRGDPAASSE